MNTYTGGTNLNGGILTVNSDLNLGTGPLSFNGGTLEALASGGGIISTIRWLLRSGFLGLTPHHKRYSRWSIDK